MMFVIHAEEWNEGALEKKTGMSNFPRILFETRCTLKSTQVVLEKKNFI
jgi:hypothetical protein